jgi:hypothetical protein
LWEVDATSSFDGLLDRRRWALRGFGEKVEGGDDFLSA